MLFLRDADMNGVQSIKYTLTPVICIPNKVKCITGRVIAIVKQKHRNLKRGKVIVLFVWNPSPLES